MFRIHQKAKPSHQAHVPRETNWTLDGAEIRKIRRRFLLLTRERLGRLQGSLTDRQQAFLDLLPLLFHNNHPLMPGYVGQDTPCGVAQYRPDKRALSKALRHTKSFPVPRQTPSTADIYAIYLMGSCGTIAYSSTSDLDIWLCHSQQLDDVQRANLNRKCDAIAQWAGSLDLEVHFYMMVAEKPFQSEHKPLSDEDSGSTQHHLLLDEFYRTGLLVAGRYPIWWLVPPDCEKDYDSYVQALKHCRFLREHEYVDFGSVADAPPSEFSSSALWHLFKGVSSPHKSLLKVLLLESYAQEYPDVEMLSLRYKRSVYDGEASLTALDPYVLLKTKVEEHLIHLQDKGRLEFFRRCFYYKVNNPLTRNMRHFQPDWRSAALTETTRAWGWDDWLLRVLDMRSTWKIDRVLAERQLLQHTFNRSYRALSQFAREHSDHIAISDHDLTVVENKLTAAFQDKADKVQIVDQGIGHDLSESELSIHQLCLGDHEDQWLLYRGHVRAEERDGREPLGRFSRLMALIAWSHFNGLLTQQTRLRIESEENELSTKEIEAIHEYLRVYFPKMLIKGADAEDYAAPAKLFDAGILLDLGVDPLGTYTRQGMRLASSQTDALCYSGWHINLVTTIDYLLITTWREIFTFRFFGMDGLMACLCEHLKWLTANDQLTPHEPRAFCAKPSYGQTVSRRVAELLSDVTSWFIASARSSASRYVVRGGNQYYVLRSERGIPRSDFCGTYKELLRYLSKPSSVFVPVTIDRYALNDTPLPFLYQDNKANIVQLYLRATDQWSYIYILDENGTLFMHKSDSSAHDTVSDYYIFLSSIRNRRVSDSCEIGSSEWNLPTEVAQIHYTSIYGWAKQWLQMSHLGADTAPYYIEATARFINGHIRFDIDVHERSFCVSEYGEALYTTLAHYLLAQANVRNGTRVCLASLDVSDLYSTTASKIHVTTAHLLGYKQIIENTLRQEVLKIQALNY